MELAFVDRGQMMLVGFSFYGDPFAESAGWTEENEIGRLWSRFMAYLADHADRSWHAVEPDVGYEVHIWGPALEARGEFEVYVGIEVSSLEGVPIEPVIKLLPPARYAVFTFRGQEITADWSQAIYQEWLPSSGYRLAHNYLLERYDARFRGIEAIQDSVLQVHIPVEPQPIPPPAVTGEAR